ncbi:MAG: hypothetical protein PVI63_05965, partial [Anaerolineae bacterium]
MRRQPKRRERTVVKGMKTLCAVATITAILALAGCLGLVPRMALQTGDSAPWASTPLSSAAPSPGGSGTLAYIGADGNVWVTEPRQGWT